MANSNKVALITGGTLGIGATIANVLNASGVACSVTGRAQNRPASIPEDIGHIPVDFLDEDSVRHFVNECSELVRPDILVNNAGINNKGRTVDFSFKDFSDILSVNLSSTYRVTQACLPSMTEKRWGRIINITSVWSILGNANNSAYCASKFAVDGFTASLAA
ncbi:MAG: NAD(P)-dependent dehydrogenase (short-subunit alcohol dehydrogenase family) [Gammaproteobacteria bacterium]|jgi:NAD(P)-dependent dehydrogenase (short-subunit alcohol dehydrogenase family)